MTDGNARCRRDESRGDIVNHFRMSEKHGISRHIVNMKMRPLCRFQKRSSEYRLSRFHWINLMLRISESPSVSHAVVWLGSCDLGGLLGSYLYKVVGTSKPILIWAELTGVRSTPVEEGRGWWTSNPYSFWKITLAMASRPHLEFFSNPPSRTRTKLVQNSSKKDCLISIWI